MAAYYNENDGFAAARLRNLIAAGHIALGDVDERSIEAVQPEDLRGYVQCHFFAGIGVWSYALRAAGWSDDSPVWTGSCPCQSFSQSGKRGGFTDKRHLWPAWFRLIAVCRPDTIFGEQVASKDGLAWLDVVSADLEGAGYAVGAVDTCAAGFGAPHIRQRVYFVADAKFGAAERHGLEMGEAARRVEAEAHQREWLRVDSGDGIHAGVLGDAEHARYHPSQAEPPESGGDGQERRLPHRAGSTNDFWRDAEWLLCRDGKYRAVEPGTFPLVDGTPNRVGRLRGYGNALVAPQAEAFIRSYIEAVGGSE